MELVNYRQEFEEEIVNLWNRTMKADVISLDRFRKKVVLDDNFNEELAIVAKVGDKIVGFCLGMKRKIPYLERGLEPEKSWISVIFVDKDHQGKGMGTMMIDTLENKLRNLGAKTIILGAYSPSYFFPGVDKYDYLQAVDFFKKRNFESNGTAVSMSCSLWNYRMSDAYNEKTKALATEQIIFHKFDFKYSLSLLKFVGDNFGGGWKRNVLMSMQNGLAENNIWLCTQNDTILGFCMRQMDGTVERFGPFGVRDDLRSKGLGGVLFEHMLEDMKANMINHIYFLWTDGAAIRFYLKHGLEIVREYELMRKEL